jgi:hypothetical protein
VETEWRINEVGSGIEKEWGKKGIGKEFFK